MAGEVYHVRQMASARVPGDAAGENRSGAIPRRAIRTCMNLSRSTGFAQLSGRRARGLRVCRCRRGNWLLFHSGSPPETQCSGARGRTAAASCKSMRGEFRPQQDRRWPCHSVSPRHRIAGRQGRSRRASIRDQDCAQRRPQSRASRRHHVGEISPVVPAAASM